MMYNALKAFLHRHPTLFNSIAGGGLCAGSDALAQRIEARNNDICIDNNNSTLDRRRFLVAGILGIFFGGFVYPQAYAILDARWYEKTLRSIVTKSVVEIGTVGIFVNTCSMTCRGLLGGRDPHDVAKHVLDEIPRVTKADVGVWMPYNLIAFSIIPAVIRPTTTAMMEASWQTYISLRSNDYHHHNTVVGKVNTIKPPVITQKQQEKKKQLGQTTGRPLEL